MENETHKAEESEEVQPLDKHEEQHNYSNDNESNEDLTSVFAQNAICVGKKLSFLVDTGANVSAIKADVWRQLPPPFRFLFSTTPRFSNDSQRYESAQQIHIGSVLAVPSQGASGHFLP